MTTAAALQLDLLAPAPPAPEPTTRRRREKSFAHTSHAAHDRLTPKRRARTRERCLQEIKASGPVGRTRQEIHDRNPDIPLQSVCSSVAALLDEGTPDVFEPVIDVGPPLLHMMREGRKIIVATLYLAHYLPPVPAPAGHR